MNELQKLIAGQVEEAQRDYAWRAAVEATKMQNLHFAGDPQGSLKVTMIYYSGELDFPDEPIMNIDLRIAAQEIIETYSDRWGSIHLGVEDKKSLANLSESLKAAAADIDSALS